MGDTDMLDTVDGHMLTTLASVKLIPMLIFSSQEEPQSPLLELSPPMLTELLYQLIPRLLLPPPLPILLPKELQSSKTSLSPLSPMSDMLDTLDGHMDTTLESVKLTVMLTLDTDMDSDMESNTSQLLHLLEVSPPTQTELLYQLTQLAWLPPLLTLTKKLPKLPETFLVELLSFNRGNNLIKLGGYFKKS